MQNIRLGIFVLAGLMFLILLLYMIGKNRNLFGATSELKAHFGHVHGLVEGNNVRFSGIQAGTVRTIRFVNDTTIEVIMVIRKDMMKVIRKDAVVSIGSGGLVGDKVINIVPSGRPASLVVEGDTLITSIAVGTEDMMETLQRTNQDIAEIVARLKQTLDRINQSAMVWDILEDGSISHDVRYAFKNIYQTTDHMLHMTATLDTMVMTVRGGKGSLGTFIMDSTMALQAESAIDNLAAAGLEIESWLHALDTLTRDITADIHSGPGVANKLLRDPELASNLSQTLENIQAGTAKFDTNMEALQHNFLLRGYFKKQERRRQKETEKAKKELSATR